MDIYAQIDAALKEVERTRTRKPILDLLAKAWDEGQEAEDVVSYGEIFRCGNPYEDA